MNRFWIALSRNGGRELLSDTFAYGLAKGIPGILGLLSVIVFLRITGEAQYGRFALITAVVNVWITFSSGWFYQGILRFGTRLAHPADAFQAVLIAGLTICGGAFLAVCLPHLWMEVGLGAATFAGLLFGLVALGQATLLAELQARLQAKLVVTVELLRATLCFGAASGLALLMSDGPAALLLGTALGYGVSVLYAARNRPSALPGATQTSHTAAQSSSSALRQLWQFGWPLSVWLAAQLVMPLIDRSMMAVQLGLGETGRYAGISDILMRCFSLAVFPITQAVYPRLAQLSDQHDTAAVQSLLKRAIFLLLTAGAITLPVLYLLRNMIVRIALPIPDPNYARLVFPLAAGGFVWQAAMLVHKPLELAQKTRVMLVAMVAAVGIKAIANWFLLPLMATLGAAVATLVAGLCYCIFCLLFSRSISK